jgi:DNA invertase Pin-like site-specific DNA recombinase
VQDRSILDQQREIQLFAEKNDLKITRWFIDADRSGTSIEHREGFQEMKAIVDNGENEFSSILIYDLSRWGRFPDPRESIYWEIYFEKKGVDILYTNDDVQNTKSFQSAITKAVKHAAAGDYSRRLSTLITRGSISQASEGFWNGGAPPYGYKRAEVDENNQVVRILSFGERCHDHRHNIVLVLGDRQEVQTVKRIFDYFVNREIDVKTIATKLNHDRIPPPITKWVRSIKPEVAQVQVKEGISTWSYCSVYKILRNELYTGKMLWGRKKRGVFPKCENSWGDRNSKKSLHDKQNVIECDWAHTPIISRTLFDKTCQIIKSGRDRKHVPRENKVSPFLLSGMIKCKTCGFGFTGGYFGTQHYKRHLIGSSHYFYRDSGSTVRGRRVCSCYYIGMSLLDGLILRTLEKKLVRLSIEKRILKMFKSMLKPLIKSDICSPTANIEIRQIEYHIAKAQLSLRENLESPVAYQRVSELLEDEYALIQRRVETEVVCRLMKDSRRIAREIAGYHRTCSRDLDTLPVAGKRTILRNAIRKIEIDKMNNTAKLHMYKVPKNVDVYLDLVGLGAKTTFVSTLHLPKRIQAERAVH